MKNINPFLSHLIHVSKIKLFLSLYYHNFDKKPDPWSLSGGIHNIESIRIRQHSSKMDNPEKQYADKYDFLWTIMNYM